jgi:acetyl/propionyl-CoA carboxylase alpha subunit
VPTTPSPVKLQKGKLLSQGQVTIVLEAMRLSSLISALGLILPQ